ncbi:MAG: aminomethyl-transferring glycine dehydrogenase subunit GcvPB [Verrucomicrobiota bacterium]
MTPGITLKAARRVSVFDLSQPGMGGSGIIDPDFDGETLPPELAPVATRKKTGLPELSEVDVVRHFTRLSQDTFGVDLGPYPLGSCTMKYNPKRNDTLAELPGFADVHPAQPADSMPGLWTLFHQLQNHLAAITGMDAFTLQPAAGAHGELTGLLIIRRHFESLKQNRSVILIPDSAHGTNPASAAMSGYICKIIPTTKEGTLDVDAMREMLDDDVAGLMMTNPSTLGLFDPNIAEIAAALHENGSLLYYDGANLNALMGLVRPGDMGFDVIHINTHKTLSTPHGGGGPGAGPCGVKAFLEPYLPIPVITHNDDGEIEAQFDRPLSVGRMKSYFGHVTILIKAYCYILSNGAEGLRMVSENAVLNANYIQSSLADLLPPVFQQRCMHECLLSGGDLDVDPFDFVKRLIDFGVHPPTLVGAGCVHFSDDYDAAMLIEPTETESLAVLDDMIAQFRKVAREVELARYMIETAPHTTDVAKIITDEPAFLSMLEADKPSSAKTS